MKSRDEKRGGVSFQIYQILKFDLLIINVLILTIILDNSDSRV
jgi:hypothetical protein